MSGPALAATEQVVLWTRDDPLVLASGVTLGPVDVAYETWGTLDADGGNAVVLCHALTGDAHAAAHPRDPSPGWWEALVGPGRPVDTDRFFVVCANLLGGCRGTTGPTSIDPATGSRYGARFPLLAVRDLVAVHRRLLAHLGVSRVFAGVGGSLGGMQLLQWALDEPDALERAVLVCASHRLTAMNIGFSAVARTAIEQFGREGMGLARRLAHLTYLSEPGLEAKFGRARRDPAAPVALGSDFEVEHYLDHQAEVFLERFDPDTYLRLTRVMDHFDPFAARDPTLPVPSTRFQLVSFDSDWRFGPDHSERLAAALSGIGADVAHAPLSSPWGHDAFLLEHPEYCAVVKAALAPR